MNKTKELTILFALWLITDAALSIAFSTDLIFWFQLGRIARLGIGLLLLVHRLPKSYAKWIGLYLAVEALGSVLVSPDNDILWQAGRIGRVLIGIWLYQKIH